MVQTFPDDLLNHAPCGFIIFSDEGRILEVNETLATMLSIPRQELIGKSIETILTLANRIFYQTHFFPLLKLHGKADEIFLTLAGKDNSEIHVLTNAVRKETNGSPCIHCIFLPVTERRKYEKELLTARKVAEEALQKNELLLKARLDLESNRLELDRRISKLSQVNRELKEFSKVISHDIQEPIRKMSLFADLALHEAEIRENQTIEKAFDRIRSSCLKMANLVNSLEEFIAIDDTDAQPEQADLNNILIRAKAKVLRNTGFTDLLVQSDDLPVIQGYPDQLEILFYNLLENAVKFRNPDRHLVIRIECTVYQENSYRFTAGNYRYGDVVRIQFSDNGLGFENEYREHVFRLFQKLHPDSEGLGIGLALCRKVTDNHFGEISVHAETGKGTEITVLLPVSG